MFIIKFMRRRINNETQKYKNFLLKNGKPIDKSVEMCKFALYNQFLRKS